MVKLYLITGICQVILIQKGKIIQDELYNIILQNCVLSSAVQAMLVLNTKNIEGVAVVKFQNLLSAPMKGL